MSRTALTVDGVTLLDADLSEWRQPSMPPDLHKLMHPSHPQAWMRPAMLAITDALLAEEPIRVDVTTHTHTWTMCVHHA